MTHADSSWSAPRRFSFQLVFCYWALDTSPVGGDSSVLPLIPWLGQKLTDWLFVPMQHLTLWMGAYVFHLTGAAATYHETGSGDTAMAWITALCSAVIASVAALVWHLVDRKHAQYRTLAAWMRLWLAVVLGLTMLSYGFAKVFPFQFGPPDVVTLTETYGDSTPMRLLWTFMGASRGYTMMAGMGEVLGGMLLLFRRTRVAGALLSGAILFNIFLLNMFYDVPVKLYSFHLLLMALTLLWPDLRGLFNLIFLRKQVQLTTDGVPAPDRRSLRIAARCIQALVIGGALWQFGVGTWRAQDHPESRNALFGAWRVDKASATFQTAPWTAVFVSGANTLMVRESSGRVVRLRVQDAPDAHTYQVKQSALGTGALHYTVSGSPRATNMLLSGPLGKGAVHVELTRTSPETFPLETQGFHWTHEYPPNH